MADRMSFWAWGLESEEPTDEDRAKLAKHLSRRFETAITPKPIPDLADAELRPPRIEPPERLAPFCFTDPYERARHSYGAHFTDRTRAFNLDFPNPPDFVAHPGNEAELEAILEWCHEGGHSVTTRPGSSKTIELNGSGTSAADKLDPITSGTPRTYVANGSVGEVILYECGLHSFMQGSITTTT